MSDTGKIVSLLILFFVSESVSYETLAGGTATTGSAYQQIQRLSECCANYRFCKTMMFLCENLVDGLLQTVPVFRLVKILSLVVFLIALLVSTYLTHKTRCFIITA